MMFVMETCIGNQILFCTRVSIGPVSLRTGKVNRTELVARMGGSFAYDNVSEASDRMTKQAIESMSGYKRQSLT